jgi:L-ribulose-5-phosphate 3-epimerase
MVTRQINYWTLGGFDGKVPVEDVLRQAKEMGFQGVELAFGAGVFAPGITEARCREIRVCAAELRMTLATLCTGVYWGQSLADPRAEVRKKAVAFTKEYLQVANWVGAKTVLVIPGHTAVPWDATQPVIPYATAWKLSTQSLRACLPTAKKLGVTLALENVWNWFLADPVAMKTFVDQFRSPNVGVYFDVANCVINGFPEHWIEVLGKRIKAVHIKNFSRSDCAGVLHGFGDDLLKGDVSFPAVVKALKKIRYAGALTAEMIPFSRLPNLVLPDAALARDTAPKMKQALAGLS